MSPARPTGFLPSQIRVMPLVSNLSWPSRVVNRSPSSASRTTIRCSSTSSKSKAWRGWLYSNMTRLVTSTRLLMERTPGREKLVLHPPGRGFGLQPAEEGGAVAGAQFRGPYLHAGQFRGRLPGFGVIHVGEPQLLLKQGRRLPGDADDRSGVSPVGGDVHLQDVIVEVDELGEGQARAPCRPDP